MRKTKCLTDFGLKVKTKLLEKRLTAKEFCKREGIPYSYFHEIIYGLKSGKKYRETIEKALDIAEHPIKMKVYDRT